MIYFISIFQENNIHLDGFHFVFSLFLCLQKEHIMCRLGNLAVTITNMSNANSF